MNRLKESSFLQAIVLSLSLTIIFVISIRMYAVFLDKNVYHCYEDNNSYSIRVYFDPTKISVIDDKVKNIIDQEKKEFVKKSKSNKSGIKYDFILGSQTKKYKDVYFNSTVIHKFTGGNHYERKDYMIIYDARKKKFLSFKDFASHKNLKKLSFLVRMELINQLEDRDVEINNKLIKDVTSPSYDNYKYFYLSDNGLSITFVPYQFEAWPYGEIKVNISWNKIYNFMEKEYRGKLNEPLDKTIIPEQRNLTKYKGKKLIAFTFDDGPNSDTTSIILNRTPKYDAKVTFFVLGSRVSYNEKVIKRAYEEGHEIASHTYSHRDLRKLKDSIVRSEIDKTNKTIKNVIGVEPVYLRPPYGSSDQRVRKLYKMNNILWNIDTLDWQTRNRNKIKRQILKTAHDGSIVLLHDIYKESVYGALMAMEELKKQGYAFVTISEMAELKNKELNSTDVYFEFK